MSFLLLIREDIETVIISNNNVFSIYHSDNLEKFEVELLTNTPDSFYFSEEYISAISVQNNEQTFALLLEDIDISNTYMEYLDEKFYQATLSLKLKIISNNIKINMTNANLVINYTNNQKLEIEIGEFNYLFKNDYDKDISLNNLSATYEEVNGINTVGGVNLDLGNRSDVNLVINQIRLLTTNVQANQERILQRDICPQTYSVNDCLGINNYNFNEDIDEDEVNIILLKNNNLELYIPLLYLQETRFIHKFSISIIYTMNGVQKEYIIDDFPYMRTSIFNETMEGDFNVYRVSNPD